MGSGIDLIQKRQLILYSFMYMIGVIEPSRLTVVWKIEKKFDIKSRLGSLCMYIL